MIEQAKFIYSPLGKALEKQTKTMEDKKKMYLFKKYLKICFKEDLIK